MPCVQQVAASARPWFSVRNSIRILLALYKAVVEHYFVRLTASTVIGVNEFSLAERWMTLCDLHRGKQFCVEHDLSLAFDRREEYRESSNITSMSMDEN